MFIKVGKYLINPDKISHVKQTQDINKNGVIYIVFDETDSYITVREDIDREAFLEAFAYYLFLHKKATRYEIKDPEQALRWMREGVIVDATPENTSISINPFPPFSIPDDGLPLEQTTLSPRDSY